MHLFVRVLGAVALSASSIAFGSIQAGTPVAANIQTPQPYPAASHPGTHELVWSHQINEPAATYLAVHFADFDLAPGDFLLITDAQGGQSYTLEGRGKMGMGTFWSQHVKGTAVLLQLMVSSATGGQGLRIDQYATGFLDIGSAPTVAASSATGTASSADATAAVATSKGRVTQAVCGTDDKRNAICFKDSYPLAYERSRPVARLLINGVSLCTGWLVSPQNYLLTNEHCISSEYDAANTDFEFMAEAPSCDAANCMVCYPGTVLSGATFVKSNIELDYALLQFTTASPVSTYGYLQVDSRPPVVGEQFFIPQHPAGRAKELALFSSDPSDSDGFCHIASVSEPACTGSGANMDLGYFADTEGGSSGSPLISMTSYKAIALHHCAICPNRAVPMTLICQDMPSGVCLDSNGFVSLDRNFYGCGQEIAIMAGDLDLVAAGTTAVVLSSSETGDQEPIILNENAPASGVFVGTMAMSSGTAIPSDGLLQVGPEDTITVTMQDAHTNDGPPAEATASARVDCAPPTISNVEVVGLGPFFATISFQTSEPSTCTLRYGTNCGTLPGQALGPTAQTVHVIQVNDLAQQTRYYYRITAVDAAGNSSTTDANGECFSFDTPGQPDQYFSELFTASAPFDLQYKSILFIPDGSANFYTACVESITALPTDPANGVPVDAGDDDPAEIYLPGSLYGVNYDEFFVGGNGYITFAMGDKTYNESFLSHFSLPRVAALFDDLNPKASGSVSLKQLPDRIAVTWLDVPEYRTTNKNTFQIELFTNGRIRISYLNIAAVDGLVGLSQGLDVPTNLVPSDLSAMVCAAAPTITSAVSRKNHLGMIRDLDLLAPPSGKCGVIVEGRAGGPTEIVLTFDRSIYEAGTTHGDVEVSSGLVSQVLASDRELTVFLTQVRNGERLVMKFPGILSATHTPVTATLCVGVLAGDVNGDCRVNLGDLRDIRDNTNQSTSPANFACDLNLDGTINLSDMIMVRNNLNRTLPAATCP